MAVVMVVDDDSSVRDLVRLSLEIDGHTVVAEAADGDQALDVMCALRPDVVVLDMMMPRVAGDEVLRRMSACPDDERPRVVAYSASATHLQVAGQLGADAVVLKSGDLAPLLAAVAGA